MAWSAGAILTAALLNDHAPQKETGVAITAANANYTSTSTAYRGGRVITAYLSITIVNNVAANQTAVNLPTGMFPPRTFSSREPILNADGTAVLAIIGTDGTVKLSAARTAGDVILGKVTYVQ